jgi:hypothetical protein
VKQNQKFEIEYLVLTRVLEARGETDGWAQRFRDLLKLVRGMGITCSNDDLKALIKELCKNNVIRVELLDESSRVFHVFRDNWDDFMQFQPWFKATETTINRFSELEQLRDARDKDR